MLSLTRKKYCTGQFLVCEPGKVSFVHAFSGCDTSSTVYEQGKPSMLKLFWKNQKLLGRWLMWFCGKNVWQEAVCGAGGKIFVMLYIGKNSDSLTYLRHKINENGFICSKCETWDFAPNRTSCYVSYIPGILALCFGATQCNNWLIPFFKPKNTFFTSTNAISNIIAYAHSFYTF